MVHLELEDGRSFRTQTVTASAVFYLVAAAVDDSLPQFKVWLNDMSNRPVPFMDFDLRELPAECQEGFHIAARIARDKLAKDWEQSPAEPPASLVALDRLVRMKESMDRGEPPTALTDAKEIYPYQGMKIDMQQIWFDEEK
jgi:hypothetical protein